MTAQGTARRTSTKLKQKKMAGEQFHPPNTQAQNDTGTRKSRSLLHLAQGITDYEHFTKSREEEEGRKGRRCY